LDWQQHFDFALSAGFAVHGKDANILAQRAILPNLHDSIRERRKWLM